MLERGEEEHVITHQPHKSALSLSADLPVLPPAPHHSSPPHHRSQHERHHAPKPMPPRANVKPKSKISASRKLSLKEKSTRDEEKVRYLGEKLPPLQISGLSMDDLQVRLSLILEETSV
ncbi:hypothetical protein HF521_004149 [Silurus meridionalis]|uniref:Uncharacterized protein n=1 Tax=Silurus meridionalis TaxID=175797 RepID=A0A8T0B0C8_SILME|nr:hypothetical protein HF521_004149 [Silurus meridionalis]